MKVNFSRFLVGFLFAVFFAGVVSTSGYFIFDVISGGYTLDAVAHAFVLILGGVVGILGIHGSIQAILDD